MFVFLFIFICDNKKADSCHVNKWMQQATLAETCQQISLIDGPHSKLRRPHDIR